MELRGENIIVLPWNHCAQTFSNFKVSSPPDLAYIAQGYLAFLSWVVVPCFGSNGPIMSGSWWEMLPGQISGKSHILIGQQKMGQRGP